VTVRASMANLILSVRTLINDTLPVDAGQIFPDQIIQDVLDESRLDVMSGSMIAKPTFSGANVTYLDYFTDFGGWEDGMLLKQYLTVPVTPSLIEPIAGHFQFAVNTFPPVYISGSLHDRYHAAADLLQRWAAQWALQFNVSVAGLSLQRMGASTALLTLAREYRMQQRPGTLVLTRSDIASGGSEPSLKATAIDYMASGQ
jgi:hypothetical protein